MQQEAEKISISGYSFEESGSNESLLDEVAYISFLSTCMEQNMEHARHVENERITFLSLYLVGVGLLLAIIFDIVFSTMTQHLPIALFMAIALLALNFISIRLLKRWNNVFKGHNDTAKRLCSIIDSSFEKIDAQSLYEIHKNNVSNENFYYYFNNRLAKKQKAAKKPLLEKLKYVSTNDWFLAFMYVVTVIEIAILGMVIFAVI